MYGNSRGKVETCVCQVTARFFKAGEIINHYDHEEIKFWSKNMDDNSEFLSEAEERKQINELRPFHRGRSTNALNEEALKIFEDAIGFDFAFFGENADRTYSSGVEAECCENSFEVLEPFLDDLIRDAKKVKDKFDKKNNSKAIPEVEVCRFLVLWKYESWGGNYEDDFDFEISYGGLVNYNKINSLVDPDV